ncbi:NYN domain-containing protein [Adlercreutzia sp. R25]|uniref:NYN domain-containing protein n=1 Tax=Adlercreutzia shanghongiae TaxID=3111773 RepID=A0ABU6IXR7_9ACTN|nr:MULTISPECIES: NYN domain-containing protein [unclassified Adlercreutzia]MEC4272486.1 NYN domain-containing protein [Adlercreutzia sp. R25]MEC4294614.1 NYN domain-containing protein [Adlercreutzia sp. R22]
MEPKTTSESSDRRFALLIDADNVSARYLKPILNELSKYGTVTIKRIYGDWTLTLHAKWKDALLENSITPIQQFGYTQGKNATDSAMIIDAMDILYTDNVDGFCLVSSDSDFTRLASRLRESGRMVIGMGEKKTPTPFRRACDVFTTLELLVQNKRNEKGGSGNAVPKDSVEQAVVDIITDNQNNGKSTGLGEIGSRLQKRYPDFDVRSYGTNLLSKLLEEFTRVRITKDHSSVTVELAEGEEKPGAVKAEKAEKSEKAAKVDRVAKTEKTDKAAKAERSEKVEEAESEETAAEEPTEERVEKSGRRSRSHRGTRRVATKAAPQLAEGQQPAGALPEPAFEAAPEAVSDVVAEVVEVVVEEPEPAAETPARDVKPGRRVRADRKAKQEAKEERTGSASEEKAAPKRRVRKNATPSQAAEEEPKSEKAPARTTAKKASAKKTAEKAADKASAEKKPSAAKKAAASKKASARKKKPASDTPAGYIRELVVEAGGEGIMLSTITDAVRAKFKDFKVRDLGYSQMRQYMASVGDYDLEKSGRNFRVRLSK